MSETFFPQDWKRTHFCGEPRKELIGQEVILNGWVAQRRDLGKLVFLVLRDKTGKSQLVVDTSKNKRLDELTKGIRHEYVLAIKGRVRARPADQVNTEVATGEIEIEAEDIAVLNTCDVLPFPITDKSDATESLRLQYRYLDMRRDVIRENILARGKLVRLLREEMHKAGFEDIETPFLYKSTPEGAREFLVPSRINPGYFYALPQSPQLFKQILMIAGFDRYYQIVKCFRDEDLRADRQPEFTQLDCEMSFVDQEDVLTIFTDIVKRTVNTFFTRDVIGEIPRMTYQQAMDTYGVDKPDTRFGLKLVDLSKLVKDSEFKVFTEAVEKKGIVNALRVQGQGETFSRKRIEDLETAIRPYGAKGLAFAKVKSGQGKESWQSSLTKFLSDELINIINKTTEAKPGDLLLFCAGPYQTVKAGLGALRNALGKELHLYDTRELNFLWVTDFPLLEKGDDGRFIAMHHPFTCPNEEDLALLETDPENVRAKAYDLVCNGVELGGGSIRIHLERIQEKIFSLLGLTKEEAEKKFGFLLKALKFGAPPHGGIAFGVDRFAMLLTGCEAIRDIIPFPKTQKQACLMTGSPAPTSEKALRELYISVLKEEVEKAGISKHA
ncbi:MAG: aspartate--tRNA ligase [Deltaproteobacteria bacterium]|nr:aspartate--tRNA ligase [Deltaproteobacteria bacterium]